MVDIIHKVGIKSSSPKDVYKALTTLEGLSAWTRKGKARSAACSSSASVST
jgi:hypothetical protein